MFVSNLPLQDYFSKKNIQQLEAFLVKLIAILLKFSTRGSSFCAKKGAETETDTETENGFQIQNEFQIDIEAEASGGSWRIAGSGFKCNNIIFFNKNHDPIHEKA